MISACAKRIVAAVRWTALAVAAMALVVEVASYIVALEFELKSSLGNEVVARYVSGVATVQARSGPDRLSNEFFSFSLIAGVPAPSVRLYQIDVLPSAPVTSVFRSQHMSITWTEWLDVTVRGVCLVPTLLAFALWAPYVRRLRPLATGCCVNCGYDLRANSLDVCSECGVSVEFEAGRGRLLARRCGRVFAIAVVMAGVAATCVAAVGGRSR